MMVHIKASSDGDGVTITVTPWQAHVFPGDELVWDADSSMIESFEVQPKAGWPFPAPHHPHAHGRKVEAGPTPPGKKGTYHYGISLSCFGLDISIDPDIVIDDN